MLDFITGLNPFKIVADVINPIIPEPEVIACAADDLVCLAAEQLGVDGDTLKAGAAAAGAGLTVAGIAARQLLNRQATANESPLELAMSAEQYAAIKDEKVAVKFLTDLLEKDLAAFEFARKLPLEHFVAFANASEKFRNTLLNADYEKKIIGIKTKFQSKNLDWDNLVAPKSLATTRAEAAQVVAVINQNGGQPVVAAPTMASRAFTTLYNQMPSNPFRKAAAPAASENSVAGPSNLQFN